MPRRRPGGTRTPRASRSRPASSHPDALADYLAAAREPDTIRGMCEDYRAAATIDLVHDRESRAAGTKIAMPDARAVGQQGQDRRLVRPAGDLAAVLRERGDRRRLESGHYIAEEAPSDLLAWFTRFFG